MANLTWRDVDQAMAGEQARWSADCGYYTGGLSVRDGRWYHWHHEAGHAGRSGVVMPEEVSLADALEYLQSYGYMGPEEALDTLAQYSGKDVRARLQGMLHVSYPDVVLTRHRGLVEWLARHYDGLGWYTHYVRSDESGRAVALDVIAPDKTVVRSVPVLAHAHQGDVRGKRVLGAMPMQLARHAASVQEVELPGLAAEQRGRELSVAEMDAAGAVLGPYMRVVVP